MPEQMNGLPDSQFHKGIVCGPNLFWDAIRCNGIQILGPKVIDYYFLVNFWVMSRNIDLTPVRPRHFDLLQVRPSIWTLLEIST